MYIKCHTIVWIRIQKKMKKQGFCKSPNGESPALISFKRIKTPELPRPGGAGPLGPQVAGSVPVGALTRGNWPVSLSPPFFCSLQKQSINISFVVDYTHTHKKPCKA